MTVFNSLITPIGGAGGGVTDHGLLSGLEDNDHPQYALVANAVMDGDAAGGVLSGTFPDPGFAVDMATQAELDAVASMIPLSTTSLPEGTNLYYTDERVDDRVAALLVGGAGIDFAYSDPGGTLTATFNASELGGLTWGDGSASSFLWTFNVSATFDPTMTFSDGLITLTSGLAIPLARAAVLIDVSNEGFSAQAKITAYGAGNAPELIFGRARGSKASPAAVTAGDTLMSIQGDGYDGSALTLGGSMGFSATQTWSGTQRGTQWVLSLVPDGSTTLTSILTITGTSVLSSQNVTIRNTAPSLTLTDTTASAKSLTVVVDANAVNLRESAGAAGSLMVLDLANNRLGLRGTPLGVAHLFTPGSFGGGGSGSFILQNTGTGNTGVTLEWMSDDGGSDTFRIIRHGTGASPAKAILFAQMASAQMRFMTNNTRRLTIDGATASHIIGAGTTFPTGGGVPVVVIEQAASNPTGMPANTAGFFAKDVAGTCEFFTIDEAGNVTQQTPHGFTMFTPPSDYFYPWTYRAINEYLGREIEVDMEGLVREVERMSNKQFMYTREFAPTQNWDAHQVYLEDQREAEMAKWDQDEAERLADQEIREAQAREEGEEPPEPLKRPPGSDERPVDYTRKPIPTWIAERLNQRTK